MECKPEFFLQTQLCFVCRGHKMLEPSHTGNLCNCTEAGTSDKQMVQADQNYTIPHLLSTASSAMPHDISAENLPAGPEMVSKLPETLAINHFIPLVPALGLGELQHRRRAEFDAIEDGVSYSLRRYLTSLLPPDRESRTQLQQIETRWLRQDPFLLPPSRQGTEASYGWHSRPYSRQSGSLKSNASGLMSFGLDPVSATGGWMNEDALARWPAIIDEDAIFDEEDHAARLAALQDREEHESLIADRNHLLNFNEAQAEHKKEDWPSDESSQPYSENSSLSSADMMPYILAEETRILPLMTCKDEPENRKGYGETIHNAEGARFQEVAMNTDQGIEAHALITTEANNACIKSLELLSSKSTRSDCWKEFLLDTGVSLHHYEKDRTTALSSISKPDIKLLTKVSRVEVAVSAPAHSIAALSDGANVDNKISTISDEATYPEENNSSEYLTEDSARDDSSVYSQDSSSIAVFNITQDPPGENLVLDRNALSTEILKDAKQAVVNQLMQEIWGIFDMEWDAEFVTCGENERKPSSPSRQSSLTSARALIQKRQRRDDDDENSSEDDSGRAPKRSSLNQKPPDGIDRLALSCPFRKHNPRKYNFPKYRPCALSSWNSVGRVKEHIYRRHRVPIHCTRCWMVFDTEDSLITHSREANRCQVQPKPLFDGIAPETERLLRSRKKEYRGQSDPELWKKMYQILFPNEIVPSPYYEAIWVGNEDHPDAQELANYDEYYRRELPRLIRSCLESTVNSQLQALESALRAQLDDIIHGCINQLSANYETARARATAADSSRVTAPLPGPLAIRTLVSPRPVEARQKHAQNNSIESVPELQPTSDYLTSLNQSPGLPPTPVDLGSHTRPYQSNDISGRCLPNTDQDNMIINPHTAPDCFCPANSCNCLGRHGLGQLRGHYLEPVPFEFDTPAKMLERTPMMEDWNLDDIFAGEVSDIDPLNLN